jgi:hypothetical protein
MALEIRIFRQRVVFDALALNPRDLKADFR